MKTQYLDIDKNMSLAHYSEYINDSSVGVVLIHGLAEHKGRYDDFIKQSLQQGISMFAIDLRGHGESSGKRGDVECFTDYLNDLHLFINNIKSNYPQLKLALLGHSLGGLIASVYSSLYDNIDLLILSSPFVKAQKMTKVLQVILHLIPYKMLGSIAIEKMHSESVEMLEYNKNDRLACHYYSIRLLGAIFYEGLNSFKNCVEQIEQPILVMGGKLDKLVNSSNFSKIFSRCASTDITIKNFEGVKHRLVQNERKDDVIACIIKWLKEHSHTGESRC